MSLKCFNTLFFLAIIGPSIITARQITIMLDPAGDAQCAGREIQDSFERGLTLQCVQNLKQEIIKNYPNIRVILTRTPGETIQPMHNALFANRLQPDLYLRIGFYTEPEIPTHVTLFYACNHPSDFWQKTNVLQFFHVDQSHILHLQTTKKLTQDFLKILQHQQRNFITHGAFAIPFKPFSGIQVPAIYLEAGLANPADWNHLIKPILNFINFLNDELS